MTPVDQTEFWTGEKEVWGDCERAVIASLLNLPTTEVPHFLREAKGDNVLFWDSIADFLKQRGLVYIHHLWAEIDWERIKKDGDIYHRLAGPSPRAPSKIWHAVVGLNGEVIHDPHPSRAGIYGDPYGKTNAIQTPAFPCKWRVAFIEPIGNVRK